MFLYIFVENFLTVAVRRIVLMDFFLS